MGVEIAARGQTVCAKLVGDIDHHSAREMRCVIDVAVRENDAKELILDFSGVTFMDSSGIAVFLRMKKRMQETDGELFLVDPRAQPGHVLSASGLGKMIPVKHREGRRKR